MKVAFCLLAALAVVSANPWKIAGGVAAGALVRELAVKNGCGCSGTRPVATPSPFYPSQMSSVYPAGYTPFDGYRNYW